MEKNAKLVPGTKVEIKGCEKFGVVVPDILRICSLGSVMVEIDATSSVSSFKHSDLKIIEFVTVEVLREKCRFCIFNRGNSCMRYSDLRLGVLVSASAKKVIPQRIYPFCKEEVFLATG